ncbi:hypothetical protein Trydic_g13298 [Trypoxylus dichotomus]
MPLRLEKPPEIVDGQLTAGNSQDAANCTNALAISSCSNGPLAPGPDSITNEILKLVYQHNPHLLLDMYNPDDPPKYRPLCMLDTADNVLERLIRTRLKTAVESTEDLSPRQHGFRRGRSTADALQEAAKMVADFSRLMANVSGPRPIKRRLLISTIQSVLLYGSEVWADALNKEMYRRRLAQVQRRAALRVDSAYRTVSQPAVLVLAEVIPMALLT